MGARLGGVRLGQLGAAARAVAGQVDECIARELVAKGSVGLAAGCMAAGLVAGEVRGLVGGWREIALEFGDGGRVVREPEDTEGS